MSIREADAVHDPARAQRRIAVAGGGRPGVPRARRGTVLRPGTAGAKIAAVRAVVDLKLAT